MFSSLLSPTLCLLLTLWGLDDLIGSDASFSDYSVMMTFKPDPFSELETPVVHLFRRHHHLGVFHETQCYLLFSQNLSQASYLLQGTVLFSLVLPAVKLEIILDSPLVYRSHKLLVAACGI